MRRARPGTLVVGVDPGNNRSGVSMWRDGSPVFSVTHEPWALCAPSGPLRAHLEYATETGPCPDDVRIFVEVPQNGTHKSRGGVHWAAGMVVARLQDTLQVRREKVHKVTPTRWRSPLVGPAARVSQTVIGRGRRGSVPKAEVLALADDVAGGWGLSFDSEDEAEAVLIGLYGCLELGVTVQGWSRVYEGRYGAPWEGVVR